jgi:nucleoside-diphosphate-sugar epimerase
MGVRIAMTGATGFAGEHVLRRLLAEGHELRALARDPRKLTPQGRLDVVAGDLRSPASLQSFAAGADVIVNLAGATAARSRADFHAINAHGTRFLAAAAAAAGVKRFIHVSSLAARAPELSPYAESKRAAEEALSGFSTAVVLRPPAIYGPGDRGTLPLIRQLLRPLAVIPGSNSSRFSLLFVEDLASVIAGMIGTALSGVHEVHDGTPGGYSWEDLAETARAVEGTPRRVAYLPRMLPLALAHLAAPLRVAAARPPLFSPGKVRELYHRDWICTGGLTAPRPTPFAEGFKRTVQWYRQEQWLPPRHNADKSRATATTGDQGS